MVEIPWWGLLYIIAVVFNGCLTYIGDEGKEKYTKWLYAIFVSCIVMTVLYFQVITESWLVYSTYLLTVIIVGYTSYIFVIEEIYEKITGKNNNDEEEYTLTDSLIGYVVLGVSYVPGSVLGILKSIELYNQSTGG